MLRDFDEARAREYRDGLASGERKVCAVLAPQVESEWEANTRLTAEAGRLTGHVRELIRVFGQPGFPGQEVAVMEALKDVTQR